jgi:spermidine synthase
VLVVDAYRDELHVPELASREFYDAAFLALAEGGVAAVNFMDDDPHLDRQLRRLEGAFGGAVLAFHAPRDPNVIALALKGFPAEIAWRELRRRAQALETRYGLPLAALVPRLRHMNRHTPQALALAPGAA